MSGVYSVAGDEFGARLRALRGVSDLESLAANSAGSFHLVASLAGHVYARGSLSQARRLYRSVVDGVTILADRARTLAWLSGARLDSRRVSACLAYPDLPHPVAAVPLWRGVQALEGAEAANLDPDGRYRATRWWSPPAGELSLDEGATALRQTLRAAVAARVIPGQPLGADLSGGLDSTSLCFLAADAGAQLVTATIQWDAPGNEDAGYAARAAAQLPGIQRLIYQPGELPSQFSGITEYPDPTDEPSAILRDAAQQRHIVDATLAAGATGRLSGHGGDHVVEATPQYLHRLVRRHPIRGLRYANGYRARDRWTPTATARVLLDTRDYRTWLADGARHLCPPTDGTGDPLPSGWGNPVALPPWVSERTHTEVAGLLRTTAAEAIPLAHDRGGHAWIHQAQTAGRTGVHLAHAGATAHLATEFPFCDDAVITACLAVAPQFTADPWSYKPLLVAAMRGLVPDPILARTTKDHCATEWYAGLREHQSELAALAENSHLVAEGLADKPALLRALLSPGLLDLGVSALEATIGTETWLRAIAEHPTPAYLQEHADEPATTR
ncbi:MAG TPA: asparagine synthase-related protein [Pseudonocardia sp.]